MMIPRLFAIMGVAIAVSGCTPTSYFGLSTSGPPSEYERQVLNTARALSPMTNGPCAITGTAERINCTFLPRHDLAMLAALGNKHAQLELGKRFEIGRGVERDLVKAERLYKRASQTSGGDFTTCVWDEYTKSCNMITISQPYVYGLPEAKTRLTELRQSLVGSAPTSD